MTLNSKHRTEELKTKNKRYRNQTPERPTQRMHKIEFCSSFEVSEYLL